MRPFGVIQIEHTRQSIENLLGRLCGAALFETNVVVDADTREVRDLLTPQPLDAAIPIDRYPDRSRIDTRPPKSQEVRQIIHTRSIPSIGRSGVVLPIPGTPATGRSAVELVPGYLRR